MDDVGGPANLASLTDGIPHSTNVSYYARIVRDRANRRAVIQLGSDLADCAYNLGVDGESQLARVRQGLDSIADSLAPDRFLSRSIWELALQFRHEARRPDLVEGLIPGDGLVLLHSQPREFKSLAAQALLLAITTGLTAFGLERLKVPKAMPAWYITEEDSPARVIERFVQLAAGVGLETLPTGLHVSAGQGVSLDDPAWQERLIANTRTNQFGLVVLDPLRSLTEAADQGPRELKPLVMFLRRFIRETGAVVLIVHHDTKPGAFGRDMRRRPQRASGGGIFSIADAPIHVERQKDGSRVLVPSDYKFMTDPPPVLLRLEEGAGWLRLIGTDVPADCEPRSASLTTRIRNYLLKHPNVSGSAVAGGIHAAKHAVLDELRRMEGGGQIASVRVGKAEKWRVLAEDDEAGSGGSDSVPEPHG